MKKYFFSAMALTTVLFMASCSNDELVSGENGDKAVISFSLGVEDGVQTRAISDGTGADKLVYAVYDENGILLEQIGRQEKAVDEWPTTVELTLAKGQTYSVAFWAQNDECTFYNTQELHAVKIDYAGINNDEVRDAFFKTHTFKVGGHETIDVVLKRPFAQLNVGVTEKDWTAAQKSNINVTKSSVIIKNVASQINLVDGKVSNPQEITYTMSTVPNSFEESESLIIKDSEGNESSYIWLSMSYLLVNDESVTGAEKANLDNLSFSFKPENGNHIEFGLNNVPVQRNWRTNIVGQILTGDIKFNISLDPIYVGDHNVNIQGTVTTQADLVAAAKAGGVWTLDEDLTIDESIWVPEGVDFTLNANGKKITYSNSDTEPYSIFCAQGPGSKITINADENSVFESTEDTQNGGGNMIVWARSGGHITINGGTFIGHTYQGGRNDAIYASYSDDGGWGTITINDGYFMVEETGADTWLLNCRWANGSSWAIQTYGGTFVGYDPALGDEQTGPNSNLPEGCVSEVTGVTDDGRNIYTVRQRVVVEGDTYKVSTADGLLWIAEKAVADKQYFAGKTISLTADIDMKDVTWSPVEVWSPENKPVFDGNGYTIKNLSNALFSTVTMDIKNLTVRDSEINTTGNFKAAIAGNMYGNIENCHVNNVTIITTGIRVGGLVGIHNSGNMTSCSAENVKITGLHSVGALVGFCNETANRTYSSCTVNGAELQVTIASGKGIKQVSTIVGAVNSDVATLKLDRCFANDYITKDSEGNVTSVSADLEVAGPYHALYGYPYGCEVTVE